MKYSVLAPMAQLIVFTRSGKMVDSCHTFLSIESILGESVYERYPILQSLQSVLEHLEGNDGPIHLPGVDFSFEGRSGYYDFELFAHPSEADWLVWVLLDNSALYKYFRPIQQERNELRAQHERDR
ncbi:MAG: hypothetical protein AAF399_27150 [Bacteroidota bacterium]